MNGRKNKEERERARERMKGEVGQRLIRGVNSENAE